MKSRQYLNLVDCSLPVESDDLRYITVLLIQILFGMNALTLIYTYSRKLTKVYNTFYLSSNKNNANKNPSRNPHQRKRWRQGKSLDRYEAKHSIITAFWIHRHYNYIYPLPYNSWDYRNLTNRSCGPHWIIPKFLEMSLIPNRITCAAAESYFWHFMCQKRNWMWWIWSCPVII